MYLDMRLAPMSRRIDTVSRGEKTRGLNAKVLSLVAAALVAISLLLTTPLASVASARVEARAGGAVAIAGDGDCDVETKTDVVAEEDLAGKNISEAENESNGDQAQSEDNSVQQVQNSDANGDSIETQDGGAVAVAGEDCTVQTKNTQTKNVKIATNKDNVEGNVQDVQVEGDDEISDRSGQPDGDTLDTSDVSTLPPEESSTEELSSDESRAQGDESNSGVEPQTDQTGEERASEGGETGSVTLSNAHDWPLPRKGELDKVDKLRRFDPEPDAVMTLAIRALGLYDVPVTNANTGEALDRGAIHVPDTAYPWDKQDQKNVLLSGHRLGSPEENGRLLFYHLDELKPGDEIVLKDRRDQSYKYRVKELFKVRAEDAWVADTLAGRDLLTLETYTLPNLEDRLVVRADRVEQKPGKEKRRK